MIPYLLNIVFTCYGFMLLARILGSWFPAFAQSKIMGFIAYYTDPYLNIFRKIIPPIGFLDISPMIALIALQLIRWILFSAIL